MKSAAAAAAPDAGTAGRHGGATSGRSARPAAVWLALAAVLLAGCETLRELIAPVPQVVVQPVSTWEAHARDLSRFTHWSLLGSLAVRSGGKATRVTMRWRQTDDSYLVRLMGPLGVGLLEVAGSPSEVEARFSNGRRARAASPEALLEQEIGWSVPLQGLRYWIVGAPAPGATPTMEFDDHGRLARLEQSGWTVVYERYGGLDDLALPERMRFSSESVDASMVVRRWMAEPDPA